MQHVIHPTPLGPLTITAQAGLITGLAFSGDGTAGSEAHDHPVLAQAISQLDEYCAGRRRDFDLPLALDGSDFSRRVWLALREIPYGTTTTYGALARRLGTHGGRPVNARAVASAVARTPVPIIVPCHRVIGADGALRGYIGGLDRKQALLALEAGQAAIVTA